MPKTLFPAYSIFFCYKLFKQPGKQTHVLKIVAFWIVSYKIQIVGIELLYLLFC